MLSLIVGLSAGFIIGYSLGVIRAAVNAEKDDYLDWSYFPSEKTEQKTDGPVSREVLGQLPATPDRTRTELS